MKIYQRLIVIAFSFVLFSCATPDAGQRNLLSANEYLQMASAATGTQQIHYQLLAAERLLKDRQIHQAEPILNRYQHTTLPADLSIQLRLLTAEYLIDTHRPQAGLNTLSQLPPLTAAQQLQKLQLSLKANQQLYIVLGALNDSQQLLTQEDEDLQHNTLLSVWNFLQTVPNKKLQAVLTDAKTPYQQGWIHLALLTQQPNLNATQLSQALEQWKAQYSDHPANALLNSSSTSEVKQLPQHIALLLPLSGQYKRAGNAIKNGFLAAYYYAKAQQSYAPKIDFYDTGKGSIDDLYQKALNSGADFIVGPLTKQNVALLANEAQADTPILALNNTATATSNNFYQFGLSPTEEAVQVANKAYSQNHTQAAVIAPANAWGQGIANAFVQRWQTLGGTVVSNVKFNKLADISNQVKGMLNIDASNHRIYALENTLGKKVRHVNRRRQDVDMIFVVGTAVQTKQTVPLLKFYYANNLPVYSISTAYQGTPNSRYYQDINGVLFTAMPWVLDPQHTLTPSLLSIRQQVGKLWPQAFKSEPKLYALGVDSFNVITHLNQLSLFPQFGIRGATGRLYLKNNNTIYRQLLWAQMRFGKAQWVR